MKTTKIFAMMLTALAVSFMSCELGNNYDSSANREKMREGENIVEYHYDDLKMRYVDGGIEHSFQPIVKTNQGREIDVPRVSEKFSIEAKAVEVQYLMPKTENFKETEGETLSVASSIDHNNGWVESRIQEVYTWNAKNTADSTDCPYSYRDSVWTLSSLFTFVPEDSTIEGYDVVFPMEEISVKEGNKNIEEVSDLIYNGKVYNAAKVTYPSTVKRSIPAEYRMDGEKYEMVIELVNTVYYLRDENAEIETSLEKKAYDLTCNQPNDAEMESVLQRNTYSLKLMKNGEVVKDSTFTRDLKLSAKLQRTSQPTITVSEVKPVTVSMIPNGGDKTTFGPKDANGIQTMTTTRKYNVIASDGGTYALTVSDEKDVLNGADFGESASFQDAAFASAAIQPTLNTSASTSSMELYDTGVSVDLPVKRSDDGSSQSYTLKAYHEEVLSIAEDVYDPSLDRVVWTVTPQGNGFDITGKKYETCSLSGEREVSSVSGRLNCNLTAQNGTVKTVQNVNFQTNGNGHNGTGNGTYTDNATNGVAADAFQNQYTWSADNAITLTLKGDSGADVTKTFSPTFVLTEAGQNIGAGSAVGTYMSYPYSNRVNAVYTLEGKNVNLSATANRELRVEQAQDEYDPSRDRVVWTVTPQGNGFDITGKKYETYTISGEREVSSVSGHLNCNLTAQNGTAKTVQNVNFQTNGNGHNGLGSGTYTDNATNGIAADAFQNQYTWSADNAITLTLNGGAGRSVTKTFSPTFVLTEAGQNIGAGSDAESYTAYAYSNTVNAVYTLENQTVNLSATATRELRVEKEIETLVGNLLAVGMSVVPAHTSGNGFADGNGTQHATMCLTLVKNDGSAAPIVYALEQSGVCQLPSNSQISNASFYTGNYDSSYNSALYNNGSWIPAKASDESWGISYTSASSYNKTRTIRTATLNNMWYWRGGNNPSTKVSDYTVSVKSGICTIKYKGQIVKQFK